MEAGNRPWLLRGLVLGLALVVGAVTWLSTRGEDERVRPDDRAAVRIVTEEELREIAAAAGYPIYWAGPMGGAVLEVTEQAENSTAIRYLDDEAELGKHRASFLAIVTYPMDEASIGLKRFADESGSTVRETQSGRTVVQSSREPTNVYFAPAEGDVQVEVFDPSAQRALALGSSEQVRPVSRRMGEGSAS